MFILVQLVLLIDFAHNWSDVWISKYKFVSNYKLRYITLRYFSSSSDNYRETESERWFCALVSATMIQYILSVFGIMFLFIKFTQVKTRCSS